MANTLKKTLLLLIDFHGHPIFGDDHTNELRYSTLNSMLQIDQREMNIVSNHLESEYPTERGPNKLKEMKRIYDLEGVHNWDRIDPDAEPQHTIQDIELIFARRNYKIHNVIIGGTNLAGCVLRSKPYSAIHWAAKGYNTQIFLPLCAEYQLPGVNQAERNSHATSIMYNVIRDLRLWDEIDIVRETKGLDIV